MTPTPGDVLHFNLPSAVAPFHVISVDQAGVSGWILVAPTQQINVDGLPKGAAARKVMPGFWWAEGIKEGEAFGSCRHPAPK